MHGLSATAQRPPDLVTPRQWVQSVTGKVSPNRRSTLSGVTVSQSKFTLAPGAETKVTATLTSAPAAGYLYGAMEVVGVPTDAATRKGVVLGYRLVGSLRVLPAERKYSITAGNVKASGATAVIPVKNAGNTVDAVSGTVKVKELMRVDRFSHVMHLTSVVEGDLKPDLDALDHVL